MPSFFNIIESSTYAGCCTGCTLTFGMLKQYKHMKCADDKPTYPLMQMKYDEKKKCNSRN